MRFWYFISWPNLFASLIIQWTAHLCFVCFSMCFISKTFKETTLWCYFDLSNWYNFKKWHEGKLSFSPTVKSLTGYQVVSTYQILSAQTGDKNASSRIGINMLTHLHSHIYIVSCLYVHGNSESLHKKLLRVVALQIWSSGRLVYYIHFYAVWILYHVRGLLPTKIH